MREKVGMKTKYFYIHSPEMEDQPYPVLLVMTYTITSITLFNPAYSSFSAWTEHLDWIRCSHVSCQAELFALDAKLKSVLELGLF